MKNALIYSLIVAVALLAAGCAKEKKSSTPSTGTVTDTGTNTGNNGTTTTPTYKANSVTLTASSFSAFRSYAMRTLNNPTDLRVTVNLHNNGNNRFAGQVMVSYYDNGQYFAGKFNSGEGVNQISYKDTYYGKSEAEFNQWFVLNGKTVFHGFFQDSYGVVILVIDQTDGVDSGDGAGVSITNLSGRVYFKNFINTTAPAPPEKCWFVMETVSPYYCATFLGSNGVINTYSALYPSNGYQLLGTFTGLNKVQAFGQ